MQKVILKKDEEQRIQNGHPWIFSNEVFSIEGKIQSGKLCDVYTYTGTFLGRGFLNTASKIMVRMLSFEKIEITEKTIDKKETRQKIYAPVKGTAIPQDQIKDETFASLIFALLFIGVNWIIGYVLYKKKIYIKMIDL